MGSNNKMNIPEMRQADKYQPSEPCLISLRIRIAFKFRIVLKIRTGKRDLFAVDSQKMCRENCLCRDSREKSVYTRKTEVSIQGVPGGMCQNSGGCSLC